MDWILFIQIMLGMTWTAFLVSATIRGLEEARFTRSLLTGEKRLRKELND